MQSHRFAICLLMLLGTAAAQNEDSFYKQQEECGKARLSSATIKAVLQEEALLLQQAGDQNSADAMARKANSIVVNPDVKN